jgi:hypothetical protein
MQAIEVLARKNSFLQLYESAAGPTDHTRALTAFFTIWH